MHRQPLGLRVVVSRAAVLGRPIGHSLSPVLHRAAYAALGLDWTYEAIDCGAGELAAALAARVGWAGFSCTMPLKRAALDVADEVGTSAKLVGAANTLLPCPTGGWVAQNTDVAGIATALAGRDLGAARVALLGAGATAQAAVVALGQLGVSGCTVLVRDRSRTAALATSAGAVGVRLSLVDLVAGEPALAEADLVVSTLPRGAADRLAACPWTADQALLDVVYDPWPTALAVAIGAAGGVVVGGAAVLLHQAAAQVELMTGRSAPVDAMRAALRLAAPGCGV